MTHLKRLQAVTLFHSPETVNFADARIGDIVRDMQGRVGIKVVDGAMLLKEKPAVPTGRLSDALHALEFGREQRHLLAVKPSRRVEVLGTSNAMHFIRQARTPHDDFQRFVEPGAKDVAYAEDILNDPDNCVSTPLAPDDLARLRPGMHVLVNRARTDDDGGAATFGSLSALCIATPTLDGHACVVLVRPAQLPLVYQRLSMQPDDAGQRAEPREYAYFHDIALPTHCNDMRHMTDLEGALRMWNPQALLDGTFAPAMEREKRIAKGVEHPLDGAEGSRRVHWFGVPLRNLIETASVTMVRAKAIQRQSRRGPC